MPKGRAVPVLTDLAEKTHVVYGITESQTVLQAGQMPIHTTVAAAEPLGRAQACPSASSTSPEGCSSKVLMCSLPGVQCICILCPSPRDGSRRAKFDLGNAVERNGL